MSDYESFDPIDSQVDLTSSFDDEFETADAPSYDEVPDGKYQVKIQTAKLESSQKGDPMIKFDLVVISGSRRLVGTSSRTLSSPRHRCLMSKAISRRLGWNWPSSVSWQVGSRSCSTRTLEVTKRTRGEYSNVYFNRRLNIAHAPSGGVADEDMPFLGRWLLDRR